MLLQKTNDASFDLSSRPQFSTFPCKSLFMLFFASFAFVGCGPKAHTAADEPVPVRLRAPLKVQKLATVSAGGAVEANITAQAAFQISGRVAKVLVDEGQPVKQGQLLAELDDTDYRNAYEAAKGQVEAARGVERRSEAGLRPQELEQARIDFERWRDEFTRMKYLYDHHSLAANDFEKVEASYHAAEQRYSMAAQGTRSEDKQSSAGQLLAATAQMHEAEKRLADCRLRAPIAGYVGMRRIDVGDTVAAGAPVLAVFDLNPVKVRVGIPEAEIAKVSQGAKATVTIPALDGEAFVGLVDAVGVAAEPASRTYTVKIAVQNPQARLKSGMVAVARIFSAKRVNALTVPGSAIVHDARGVTQVYVYDATRQRVYARRVEVGDPINDELEIRDGLTGDEQVVVAGQQNVREASPVKLVGGEL